MTGKGNHREEEENRDSEHFSLYLSSICEEVKSDISNLFFKTSNERLKSFKTEDLDLWLAKRPSSLVKVIKALCGLSTAPNAKDKILITKIIELVYGARNSRLVLPLSFNESLLTYAKTHSKTLVTYNSKISPSGSYTFLENWLTNQTTEPIPFPSGQSGHCLITSKKWEKLGLSKSIKSSLLVLLPVTHKSV